MGNLSDKIKNKRFQKKILIYIIIFVVIILLLNWLAKSEQANRMNQAENFNVYYKGLLAQCDKASAAYTCCFNSVAYMAANNFKQAGIGCDPGFKLNMFKCEGSYKWCEMVR